MRGATGLLAGIALLAACGAGESTAPGATDQLVAGSDHAATSRAMVRQQLARLRQVTAPFHDINAAAAAGWSTKITDCMASDSGGMGFHYGNTNLIDGTVRVEQPELLLYEPEESGRMRLVAVEYIIPYAAHARDAEPPVLFGQKFSRNDTFQLWGLHAWVWRDNPNGMFANWNPRVTCDYASAGAMTMSN